MGKIPYLTAWVAVVNSDPEAESLLGINLAESMQGAAAGTVDHPLGAAGLRAEITGFGQGTVPAHATAKEERLDEMFTKGVEAAGLIVLVGPDTDCSGQGKNEPLRLECGVVNLPIDAKAR